MAGKPACMGNKSQHSPHANGGVHFVPGKRHPSATGAAKNPNVSGKK